jgi:ketosteroid isomerase-like protein
MATPEDHKNLVRTYFDAVNRSDGNTVVSLLADDIVWWIPAGHPLAGTYEGKPSLFAMWGKAGELFSKTEPMKVELGRMTAEGGFVAIEAVVHAKTAKGKDYVNQYHFLFELAGGKVKTVREHLDTAYATKALVG